jgi:hypothetical protein
VHADAQVGDQEPSLAQADGCARVAGLRAMHAPRTVRVSVDRTGQSDARPPCEEEGRRASPHRQTHKHTQGMHQLQGAAATTQRLARAPVPPTCRAHTHAFRETHHPVRSSALPKAAACVRALAPAPWCEHDRHPQPPQPDPPAHSQLHTLTSAQGAARACFCFVRDSWQASAAGPGQQRDMRRHATQSISKRHTDRRTHTHTHTR